MRAGDASRGLGWQISPRCQWVPALEVVSPQSFAFPVSQSTEITPTLDFCILQTMCCSPFCFPSSDGSTDPLQVPCTGTGLQTPLPDCLGVKSLFLCTREVSGGNTCSWKELSGRVKCDGPCAFREFSVSLTNTYPYSLLLIFNIKCPSLSSAKKTAQCKEAQQGKPHTKGRKCLTDTFQSQFSCSALQWLPCPIPIHAVLFADGSKAAGKQNQGYLCRDSSSSVSCTLPSQSCLTLACVLESPSCSSSKSSPEVKL